MTDTVNEYANLKVSLDDLFGEGSNREHRQIGKLVDLPVSELFDFPNHPFKVRDDKDMRTLLESIGEKGILQPIITRQRTDGGYEIISGHRRKFACDLAGIKSIPAIVRDYDDDEAIILLVDSNIQRENILPSERAFSFKMKLEAMNRKLGRPTKNVGQVVPHFQGKRSTEIIAEGSKIKMSYKQVERFIDLTRLIPQLLDMVDEAKIAFNPAVELSYLEKEQQEYLLEMIELEEATPSLKQSKRMKKMSQEGTLTNEEIENIMMERKPNQVESLKIKPEQLERYFKPSTTPEKMIEKIIAALDFYEKHHSKKRDDAVR